MSGAIERPSLAVVFEDAEDIEAMAEFCGESATEFVRRAVAFRLGSENPAEIGEIGEDYR